LTAIVLAIVTVRVLTSSRAEWRAAEGLAGDEAIDHYGRAARLYTPGNPWSRRALDKLEETARAREAAGDREGALSAWREVRSSILATRAIYTPNRERLPTANEHIAILTAAIESPSVDPGADESARRLWHAERLAKSEEPSVGWSLAALAGLFAWIACALGFFFRGFDESEHLRRRAALAWAGGVAAGIALFVIALGRA
jgi:hypothetical protein